MEMAQLMDQLVAEIWPLGRRQLWKQIWESLHLRDFDSIYPEQVAVILTQIKLLEANLMLATLQGQLMQIQGAVAGVAPGAAPGGAPPAGAPPGNPGPAPGGAVAAGGAQPGAPGMPPPEALGDMATMIARAIQGQGQGQGQGGQR
jgi:hypothetical protein